MAVIFTTLKNNVRAIVLADARGILALQVLIFGAAAVVLLAGFTVWLDVNIRAVQRESDRAIAFAIAEAGIEYYRWHLAHASTDYQDGTTSTGPFIHDYYDKDSVLLGTFTLDITPPILGSTIVTVKSTGKLAANSSVEKSIVVRLGIPSFAKYAAVLNANVRFGQGTDVFGEIHSNQGVRFDGTAHNVVTSFVNNYDDPDHSGSNEYGVHTHRNPPPSVTVNDNFRPLEAPTSTLQARTDVFLVGRELSVPFVDFSGVTQDLADIRTAASSSGFYMASSTALGYDVVLNTDDTFTLYRVMTRVSPPGGCSSGQSSWGTWSINTENLIGTYPIPANGLIFLEDDVWVRGQINSARITIAAARFPVNPTTYANVTLNSDLRYTNYDGTDAIGIIAQNNVNIGLRSANVIRVDAALIAQNGRVGRHYYNSSCGAEYIRSTITTYGMIGSSQRYGFAYTNGTGYQIRNLNYDANLLYGPPPSFPLTDDPYQIISWDEIE